jgi:hypothetical protein
VRRLNRGNLNKNLCPRFARNRAVRLRRSRRVCTGVECSASSRAEHGLSGRCDIFVVPSYVPHQLEALADSVIIEIGRAKANARKNQIKARDSVDDGRANDSLWPPAAGLAKSA